MNGGAVHTPTRWTAAAYGAISIALVLVVLLNVWEGFRDLNLVRTIVLRSEMSRLRSHAVRMVGRIEQLLEQRASAADLDTLMENGWFTRYWERVTPRDDQQMFAAIVEPAGRIVLHTQPELVGSRLERRWYDRVVFEADEAVVQTRSPALTGGVRMMAIRIPIIVHDEEVAEYYTGFDEAWLDDWVAGQRADILRQRVILGGLVLVVVLAAFFSLYYLAVRKSALRRTVRLAEQKQAAELERVANGLAHEIRNPMHAIRLNLHALGKMIDVDPSIVRQELATIVNDSNREIDRVDHLMRELVSFASPQAAREQSVDIAAQCDSVLSFLSRQMEQNRIEVVTRYPERRPLVHIDPDRLRQMLLKLIENAMEFAGSGGRVVVSVHRNDGEIAVTVADSGPGVAEQDRERIFEPFYSTKENGRGLGLALVRRFAREAGGSVTCEPNEPSGTRFRIDLPETTNRKEEPQSGLWRFGRG
jgi:two-component system, NtrC family, sensor histidine kinase HydH